MGYAMPIQGNPQYIRAGEIILLSCWIEGDEILKTEEYIIDSAMQAFQIMKGSNGTLKKL